MTPAPGSDRLAARRAAYRRGRGGETRAAWYLRAKGYRILARGYRCAVGEIDVIARRGSLVVAVEVKARPDLASAVEAIGARQRHRIVRAMGDFLARHPQHNGCDVRFDALLVMPWRLPRHISDAWRPDDGQ